MGVPPKTLADQIAAATPGVTPEIERLKLGGIPEVSFRFRDVEPPSNLYIGPDDFLVVTIVSAVAGETVTIQGRLMLVTGEIKTFLYVVNSPTLNGFTVKIFPLAEGYFLGCQIFSSLLTTQRGQLFVSLAVQRGPNLSSGITTAFLLQDYIDLVDQTGWPPGRYISSTDGAGAILSTAVANPAAGADWSFTVPAQSRAKVRSVKAQLATSATAGARLARLQITDGTNVVFTVVPTITQTVSLTWTYDWALGMGGELNASANNFVGEALPDMLLEPGWVIGTSTAAISATDQWSLIRLETERWISV